MGYRYLQGPGVTGVLILAVLSVPGYRGTGVGRGVDVRGNVRGNGTGSSKSIWRASGFDGVLHADY
jgi:hypothetical protein